MSFSLSTLTAYVNENENQLVRKSIAGSKTASMMTVQAGIKSAETINILASNAVYQSDSGCGWNSSGTTSITQRVITVGKIKVNEAVCPKDLAAYYTQKSMAPGSSSDNLPGLIEEMWVNDKIDNINYQNELAIWQGDTGSGTAYLARFDGLLKILDASFSAVPVNAQKIQGTVATTSGSATVTGTGTAFTTQLAVNDKVIIPGVTTLIVQSIASATSFTATANASATVSGVTAKVVKEASDFYASPVTSITSSNAISIFQSVYKAIPVAILGKPDVMVFCGMNVFRTYQLALVNANLFHYNGQANAADMEITIPGTNIKVVAVNGLNNTNRIIACQTSNMYLGTDLQNEEERFEVFFAKEADEVRFDVRWKMGVQFAFPDHVVNFELTA